MLCAADAPRGWVRLPHDEGCPLYLSPCLSALGMGCFLGGHSSRRSVLSVKIDAATYVPGMIRNVVQRLVLLTGHLLYL